MVFNFSHKRERKDAVITITAQNNLTRSDRTASIIITTGQEGKANYLSKNSKLSDSPRLN